jgi:hypothetical protein
MTAAADRPLYFLHIPKTGGSSLRAFLRAQFAPEAIIQQGGEWVYHLDQLRHLGLERAAGFRLIQGHLGYLPMNALSVRPVGITVLREPLARSLSHLRHIQRSPGHWYYRDRPYPAPSLAEMLEDERLVGLLRDFQARSLALDPPMTGPNAPDRMGAFLADTPGPGESELWERALARLDAIAFVGVTEDLAAVIGRLSAAYGWLGQPPPQANVAPEGQQGPIEAGLRDKLESLIGVDRRLYQAALERQGA